MIKVVFILSWKTEEFHLGGQFVVGCNLEGENIDSIQHALKVHKELLAVPDVVAVFVCIFWVFDTSWVTTSDEVGDSTSNTGASVPQNFSGTTVVHGAWPYCENDVFGGESTIID